MFKLNNCTERGVGDWVERVRSEGAAVQATEADMSRSFLITLEPPVVERLVADVKDRHSLDELEAKLKSLVGAKRASAEVSSSRAQAQLQYQRN